MNNKKRTFFGFMVFALVFWSFGLTSLPGRAATLVDGDLIKASGAAVYYYDADEGERWVFPNSKTYATWFGDDFSKVKTVTDDELAAIPIGGNVTYRPGTRWVKITTDPKVYAVEQGGMLRWVSSEAMAVALHGSAWNTTIDDVPDAFFAGNYDVSDPLEDGMHPLYSLITYAGDADVFVVNKNDSGDLVKRLVSSGDAFAANWWMDKYVYSTTVAYEDGDPITGAEAQYTDLAWTGGETTPGGPSGSGLTVGVSTSNPVAQTLVADTTTGDGAQAFAKFLALNFTAASDGAVTVSQVKFTRSGVASDRDLSNVYLFENDRIMAEMSSFNNKVVSFNDDFTVKAGETRTLWLAADLANGTTSGKTIGFDLASTSDVTTDGATVSFGGKTSLMGPLHTTATVANLGKFSITNTGTFPSTIDAGPDVQELWRFTVQAQEQEVDLYALGITMVGTIKDADLQDIYLEVDGLAVTETQQLSGNKLDFTFDPWKLTQGQTKIVILRGTVVGGAGRAFEWMIRDEDQVLAKDREYGVYLKLNQNDTFALIESDTTSTGTTINSGTLTITRSADSPNGDLPLGALGVTLAKFDLTAYGEDIKVDTFNIRTTLSDQDENLNNGKLLLDGTQIGVTTDLDSDDTATSTDCPATYDASGAGSQNATCFSSFGNTVIVKAGETSVLSVVADVLDGDGNALDTGATLTILLNAGGDNGANNATRQFSLGTFATNSSTANQLTLTSGAVSIAKNLAVADGNASNATGVVGGTNLKISSFTITASAAEGADVTSLTLQDEMDGGDSLSDVFQNMKVMYGDRQIGTTKGTLTDGNPQTATLSYTFSATPAISLVSSQQIVLDVYADTKTGADTTDITADTDGEIQVTAITATGKVTSTSVGLSSQTLALQDIFLAANGTVTIYLDSSTPQAGQLVMGDADQTLAIFKLDGSSAEASYLEKLVLSVNTWDFGAWSNLKLYNENGQQLGSTVASLSNRYNGTAGVDGTTSKLCLSTADSSSIGLLAANDDDLNGMVMAITNGTGEGQSAIITDYDAAGDATCGATNGMADPLIDFSVAPTNAGTSIYKIGGQAVFDLGTTLQVPKGDDMKLTLKGTVNQHPNSVSGIAHIGVLANTLGAQAAYLTTFRGKDSNVTYGTAAISGWPISGNAQDVYRTKATVVKNSISPSGTSIAGANSEVLRFDVTAHANRDAVLNAVAFTLGGTQGSGTDRTITGEGSANLYKSTDLQTALATEAYVTATWADQADASPETDFQTNDANCTLAGIPVNATVLLLDGGVGGTVLTRVVETVDSDGDNDGDCTSDDEDLTFVTNATDIDPGDLLRYYPLLAGSGKLYFGAMSPLDADLTANDVAFTVPTGGTDGFAVNDVVRVQYVNTTSNATASQTCTAVMSLTTTAIALAGTGCATAVDHDYLYAASTGPTNEALTTKFFGRAVVYTGTLNSSAGEEVSKGTTKTLIIKGDTTGFVTNDTLRVDINATADFQWDDGLMHTITTDTDDIPVIGGTLIY